jgi:membrane-bound lytic murein transglycosylase B
MFPNKTSIFVITTASFLLAVAVFVFSAVNSRAAIINEYEADLSQKLDDIQKQIEQTKKDLQTAQGESQTLAKQIKIYDTEIQKTLLELEETDLMLQESDLALLDIKNQMKTVDGSIEKQRMFLRSSIRTINEYNSNELDLLLSSKKLSDIFDQLNSIELINKRVGEALQNIRSSREEYTKIQKQLEEERATQQEIRLSQKFKENSLDAKKSEKNQLLKETRGKESLYKKLITESEKKAEEIKNQLFVLQNMGGTLRFEDAMKLALYAGKTTGIRPAFLLAVLSKESNIGQNLGTGTWKKDMYDCYVALGKPDTAEAQKKALLSITGRLNLDPNNLPFSKEPDYGCGGAMGAAQFIPTTWLGYEDRIEEITGHNPPNPWNITDAFVASSLYLQNLGADTQTEDAEWTAAMKYLAGSNWQKKSLQFYGDHVMEIAAKIQKDIDIINK